eukprot:TRINITY_DN3132_c0_g2_i1.p1 TRINITY_DN3132_c0_g2~~TRINITY_DN3132_c0_g2_i1.p1  ORF type:complete len:338 (+),score=39.99 TRINITY_DN3132_c0_g2_i1:75-1088(+)
MPAKFWTLVCLPIIASSLLLLTLYWLGPLGLIYFPRYHSYQETPETCCEGLLRSADWQIVSFNSWKSWDKSEGKVKLEGWYFPQKNATVGIVVVHGHGANMGRRMHLERSVLEKAVLALHVAGFSVLALDLRNHGSSGLAPPVSMGLMESFDVLAGVRWLREKLLIERRAQNDTNVELNIGVWGESMGGASVIFAAAYSRHFGEKYRISAVASDSPFASVQEIFLRWLTLNNPLPFKFPASVASLLWNRIISLYPWEIKDIRPDEVVEEIEAPVLFIHGEDDPIAPWQHSERMHLMRIASGLPSELVLHPLGHVRPYELPGYFRVLIEFFRTHTKET